MLSTGSTGFEGNLSKTLLRPAAPRRARSLRVPGLGRVMFTRDQGQGAILSDQAFTTNLTAYHRDRHGRLKDICELGSGTVQQNFVMALAADQIGTTTNKAAPILANSGKYMYSGTGATVNVYDYQLATTAATASGLITPALGISTNSSTIQYVGTVAYTGTLAITEWGLFNNNSQGAGYTASSFSGITTTTVTPTTNPTWTVNQWAGYVVVDTSAGTRVGGYIISNTATALTIATFGATGWYQLTVAGGTGTTPITSDTLSIFPLMSDHKSFAAINVISGDSVQFTYTLTLASGG